MGGRTANPREGCAVKGSRLKAGGRMMDRKGAVDKSVYFLISIVLFVLVFIPFISWCFSDGHICDVFYSMAADAPPGVVQKSVARLASDIMHERSASTIVMAEPGGDVYTLSWQPRCGAGQDPIFNSCGRHAQVCAEMHEKKPFCKRIEKKNFKSGDSVEGLVGQCTIRIEYSEDGNVADIKKPSQNDCSKDYRSS